MKVGEVTLYKIADAAFLLKQYASAPLNEKVDKTLRRNIGNTINEALRDRIIMPHFDITYNIRAKIWK